MIPASIAPMRAHPIPIPTADPVEIPPIPTKAAEVVGLKVEVEAGVGGGLRKYEVETPVEVVGLVEVLELVEVVELVGVVELVELVGVAEPVVVVELVVEV